MGEVREIETKEKGKGEGPGWCCEPRSEMTDAGAWDGRYDMRSAAGCRREVLLASRVKGRHE